MLTKWAKGVSFIADSNSTKNALPRASFPTTQNQKANIKAKNVSGDNIYITEFLNTGYSATFRAYSSISTAGIYVGSDGTAATDEDYTLGHPLAGLSGNISAGYSYDSNNDMLLNIDITLTNSSGSEVTIREIGYAGTAYYSDTFGGTPSSSTTPVLIDRTVLDAPMTIASGDVGVLRYQFKYPAVS